MVFSLFARKEKADPRRGRDPLVARSSEPRTVPAPDTLAAQREAARRTEEKINRIESEMISAHPAADAFGPSTAAAPRTLPAAAPALEAGTSEVLGAGDAMAIDVNGSSLPSVLEEAAILYSNGQAAPAAATLRHALADPELGAFQQLAWLMLLDLFQVTGDRAAFERLALEYASRFESSPPAWTEALAPSRPAAAKPEPARPAAASGAIEFPAALDASVASLVEQVVSAGAARPEVVTGFGAVRSVDAAGAEMLVKMIRGFARGGRGLLVRDAHCLLEAARAAIEPGRRDESQACWMLALEALRMLGQQQEFEDLSIDYCVTYEVSPPSWEPMPASVRVDTGAGQPPAAAAPVPPRAQAGGQPQVEPNAFVLRGDVLGRMQAELQALRAYAARRGEVVVDCRQLRRMEFVAAGDLLNEVVTLRGARRQVLFVEPNYLVYALMLVMGIHDLAEIRRRRI